MMPFQQVRTDLMFRGPTGAAGQAPMPQFLLIGTLALAGCIADQAGEDAVDDACQSLDGAVCADVPDAVARDVLGVPDAGPDAATDATTDAGPDGMSESVCCRGALAWPSEMSAQECAGFAEAVPLPLDQCDEVCCGFEDALGMEYDFAHRFECREAEGTVQNDDSPCEEVCCSLDEGDGPILDVTPRYLCQRYSGEVLADQSACKTVCCRGGAIWPIEMSLQECWEVEGALAAPLDHCEEVCCSVGTDSEAVFDLAFRFECLEAGGTVLDGDGPCQTVCCENEEDGFLSLLPRGMCDLSGSVLPDESCETVCCQDWTTASLKPIDECSPTESAFARDMCEEVCCSLPASEGAQSETLPLIVCLSYGGLSQDPSECLCGNGACDPGEDDRTCPEDCGCTALLAGGFGTYHPFCWNHDLNRIIKTSVGCRCHHHCWIYGDCCADWDVCGMEPPRCGDGACLTAEIDLETIPHLADQVWAFENYSNCPQDCEFQRTCASCTPGRPWSCPDFCGCAKPAEWENRDLECLGRDDFCFVTDEPQWCEERQTFVQPRTPAMCSCDPECYGPNYCCPDALTTCGMEPPCGDGHCTTSLRENCGSCPQDCGTCPCGDGICRPPSETAESCPKDCYCGDGVCHEGDGEDRQNCPRDCSCGNRSPGPSWIT